MEFQPEKLRQLRQNLGITKAEAARRLNMSAMGYGRYESGEREPSFQVVSFIAQTFGTTTDYLYGITNSSEAEVISISAKDDPEMFEFLKQYKENPEQVKRLLKYAKLTSVLDK